MKSSGVLALSVCLFLGSTLAAPVNKRDLVVVTLTSNVVEIVDVTTTIYVGADATSSAEEAPASTTATTTTTTTTTPSAVVSTSTPSSTLTTSSTTPAAYVAPTPSTTPTSTSIPSPTSTPSSTSAPAAVYTPPTSSSTPASTSASQAPASSAAAQSVGACSTDGKCSSSSAPCCGDITHYDTDAAHQAKGACGWVNDGTVEDVIALPHAMMGLQSNGNPFCGRTVMVSLGGKQVPAKVVDKCMGCEGQSIDLSDHVFGQLGNPDIGRMKAQWWFTS